MFSLRVLIISLLALLQAQAVLCAFNLVNLNSNVSLAQPFTSEGIINVQSTSNNIQSVTGYIRLLLLNDNSDQILHMSIRPSQNEIVFNSRTASGPFGPEQKVPLTGLFQSQTPTVTFYDHSDRFQVMVDFKTIIYYNKRSSLTGTVTRVGYEADSTSFLSNPLGVTPYTSFADVYPRNV
ncbi:hypothetical protein AX17_005498 [Amanita inopinata Kibby_2008]|nr:hypothetical protein AX17_005498 [Amanita inopinata Kibby_2008]